MISIGSVYSGIAGLDVGLLAAFVEARIRARIAWHCEIDPFCSRVLERHFPNVTRFTDVAKVHNPPRVQVLSGGFACQDVSSAGKGLGLGRKTRSGHTLYHLLRLIDETRAPYLVIENVASGARRWLPVVVRELRDRGYRSYAVPLSAAEVEAPHLRRRVFVVAYRGRDGIEGLASRAGQREGRDVAHRGGSLADRDHGGRKGERRGGLRQGERLDGSDAARGHDTHRRRGAGAGSDVADAGHARLEVGRQQQARSQRAALERGRAPGGARSAQSRVGLRAHGLPFDVAGHRWPAGRDEAQRRWEPARTVSREVTIPDRPAMLMALGNAVVPQCGLVVGRVLVEVMRARRHA